LSLNGCAYFKNVLKKYKDKKKYRKSSYYQLIIKITISEKTKRKPRYEKEKFTLKVVSMVIETKVVIG